MHAPPDYYEVLQVSPNADMEVVQAAYQRLVAKWHAERRPGDPSAFGRLSLLDESYAVLSDPLKRQEYDSRGRQPATCGVAREEPSLTTAEGQQGEVIYAVRQFHQEEVKPAAPTAEMQQDVVPASNKDLPHWPPRAAPTAEMQRDIVSAAWGSGPYSQQQRANDGGANHQAQGNSLPTGDANRKKMVSTAAWVLFLIGLVLFMAGQRLDPVAILFRCLVWGLFFGIAAYLDLRRKKRAGLTLVATLFFLAAGFDVFGPFFARTFLQPSTEVTQSRVDTPQAKTFGDMFPELFGNYDKAIEKYTEVIRLNPKDSEAYESRGFAWKGKGDLDKAIKDYDEAIRLDPSKSLTYASRGGTDLPQEKWTRS